MRGIQQHKIIVKQLYGHWISETHLIYVLLKLHICFYNAVLYSLPHFFYAYCNCMFRIVSLVLLSIVSEWQTKSIFIFIFSRKSTHTIWYKRYLQWCKNNFKAFFFSKNISFCTKSSVFDSLEFLER